MNCKITKYDLDLESLPSSPSTNIYIYIYTHLNTQQVFYPNLIPAHTDINRPNASTFLSTTECLTYLPT